MKASNSDAPRKDIKTLSGNYYTDNFLLWLQGVGGEEEEGRKSWSSIRPKDARSWGESRMFQDGNCCPLLQEELLPVLIISRIYSVQAISRLYLILTISRLCWVLLVSSLVSHLVNLVTTSIWLVSIYCTSRSFTCQVLGDIIVVSFFWGDASCSYNKLDMSSLRGVLVQ